MEQRAVTSGTTIRFARPSDVPSVFALIRDLAEYEHLSHEVSATEAALREHLFGDRRYCEVLIAEGSEGSVGFALFFHNYSTFQGRPGIYLEDLFVVPEARGQGHGKALLAALARLAVERGCGRLEWSVLDWNAPSIQFYRAVGAIPMSEWTTFRLTGPALQSLGERGRPVQREEHLKEG